MAQKGIRKVQKNHKNLSNETAEKWLKMSQINAKGPTVPSHSNSGIRDLKMVHEYLLFNTP